MMQRYLLLAVLLTGPTVGFAADRADNFNRANDATSLGIPSDGGAGYTVTPGHVVGILNNQAYYVSGSGEGYVRLTGASADVEVSGTLHGATFVGALVRYQSNLDTLWLYRSAATTLRYQRVVGGTPGDTRHYAYNDGESFAIRAEGDTITIFVNGVQVDSFTEAAGNTNTNHGFLFLNGASSGTFDNLVIDDLAASFDITEPKVLVGTGTVTINLVGNGTTWAGTPFSLNSPPAGWTIASQNVTSATTATVTLNRGTGIGNIAITDGTLTSTVEATNTVTSVVDGDWNTLATWDLGVPGTTNIAQVEHNLTLAAATTIGDMVLNGSITGTEMVLTRAGDTEGSGDLTLTECDIILDPDADDDDAIVWEIGPGATYSIQGTAINRSTISKIGAGTAYFTYDDVPSPFYNLTLRFLDLSGLADPTNTFAWVTRQGTILTPTTVTIEDVNADGCAAFPYQMSVAAEVNYAMRRVKWTNIIGDYACQVSFANTVEDETCTLYRCTAPATKPILIGNGYGLILDGCGEGIVSAGTWNGAICRNIFFRGITGGVDLVTFGFNGVSRYDDCFLIQDDPTTSGNPHFLNVNGATVVVDGCIFDYPKALGFDAGECILGNNVVDFQAYRNICVPSETDGITPGYLINVGSLDPPKNFVAEHNTTAGGAARLLFMKETSYDSTGQTYSHFRSNIAYVPDTTHGYAYVCFDLRLNETPYDVIDGNGATHNGLFNPVVFNDDLSGGAEYLGYYHKFPVTGPPGANDIYTDPQFVDYGRNFIRWVVYKGYIAEGPAVAHDDPTWITWREDAIDAGVAAILNDPALIELDLVPWVKAGYAPTNPDYATSAHDGTTIGAMEFSGDEPLAAPALSVVSTTDTSITISWPAATGGTAPYTYDIDRSLDGTTWTEVGADVDSPYELTGLTSNITYHIRLRVTDSAPMIAGPAILNRRRRRLVRRKTTLSI